MILVLKSGAIDSYSKTPKSSSVQICPLISSTLVQDGVLSPIQLLLANITPFDDKKFPV